MHEAAPLQLPIPLPAGWKADASCTTVMTSDQFDVLARLTRGREPARSAVKRVLVDGISQADAAREFGMPPSALGNSVRRYRAFDALVRAAYLKKLQ